MKRATTIVAALLLAVVVSLGSASPASANQFDGTSYSTCQAERVEWTSSSYTTHSHLAYVHPDWAYVEYHCCLDLYGLSHRWNHSARWWNNATTSRNWSSVYSGDCP